MVYYAIMRGTNTCSRPYIYPNLFVRDADAYKFAIEQASTLLEGNERILLTFKPNSNGHIKELCEIIQIPSLEPSVWFTLVELTPTTM